MDLVATAPTEPFSVEAVTPFLRMLVQGKRRLFHHFADLDEDDLFQLAVMSARDAHASYRVGKGSARKSPRYHHALREDGLDRRYVSWLGRAVTCDLLDLYRKRVRQSLREARAAVSRGAAARVNDWHEAGEDAGLPGGLGDGGDELPDEWLGRMYRFAVYAFTPPAPALRYRKCPRGPWEAQGRPRSGGGLHGRKWFTQAQCVCAALLMRREGLSSRQAAARFASSPELASALQLKRLPSWRWFVRAQWVARHLGIPDVQIEPGQ